MKRLFILSTLYLSVSIFGCAKYTIVQNCPKAKGSANLTVSASDDQSNATKVDPSGVVNANGSTGNASSDSRSNLTATQKKSEE